MFYYGSIGAAIELDRKDDDNAIICAGGLHHVKKSLASRFCYGDMFFGYLYFLYIIGYGLNLFLLLFLNYFQIIN